jgi:uncharacterized delta-60 repeat protein
MMRNINSFRNWSYLRKAILPIFLLLMLAVGIASVQALTLVSETTWGGANAEVAEGAAVASDGSSYVVGTTHTFGNNLPNIFLLKFAADGSLAWQRTWEGPTAGFFASDEAEDVAVAPDDSVYVTGLTPGVGGDVVLLKFAPDGSLVWQRTWGGSGTERGQTVAVAADGSVYVAGSTNSFGSGEGDGFLLKFASDGTLIWQKTGPVSMVAVAPDGTIYAAGTVPRPDGIAAADVLLLKLDPAGNVLWQRTYSAGDSVDPRGGITIAPDGSVYVAGAIFEEKAHSVDLDVFILNFAPDGSLVWERAWGGRDGDEVLDVTTAADGTIFFTGGTASFGTDDAFIVHLAANGKAIDAMSWGGAGLEVGKGIAVASDGTISLAASAEAPPYLFDRAATKTSRLRGTLTIPTTTLVDVVGTVAEPAGVVTTPDGSLTYAGSFDAALVRITP